MTIPIVEEMHCEICDDTPTQIVMKENSILCGFCGEVMYEFTEKDMVTDWAPNWSQELRDVMNGLEPLVSEISKKGEEE
tara:strand:+ start:372 stop:608 length:237 start_codon:yes stop_codon:yes gene_type:complete